MSTKVKWSITTAIATILVLLYPFWLTITVWWILMSIGVVVLFGMIAASQTSDRHVP